MISYSFRCGEGHEFSVRFKNADSCKRQLKRGLVECPYCGDVQVEKLLSAPAVTGAEGSEGWEGSWRDLCEHVKREFDDVGDNFAHEARRIHYGESEERGIYGRAESGEVKDLLEEGVRIFPLPMVDEKKKN